MVPVRDEVSDKCLEAMAPLRIQEMVAVKVVDGRPRPSDGKDEVVGGLE